MGIRDDALAIVDKLSMYGIEGVGPLKGAVALAREYEDNLKYASTEERIDALIAWESAKNFTTGFVTGLGGLIVLPVAVPAALGASWIIQARLSAAIAVLSGFDIRSDQVRSLVVLALVGDSVKEVLKDVGVQLGRKATQKAIEQIPGRIFIAINKKVGFRLITKAGEKGVVNMMKVVPIIGGLVGGTIDGLGTRAVGRAARELFPVRDSVVDGSERGGPRPDFAGTAA